MPRHSLETIRRNPALFVEMSDSEKTEEMCLIAVSVHGSYLEHVPLKLASETVLLRAIQQESHALAHVNFERQRPDFLENLMFVAISYAPTALEYVPDQFQTKRLVEESCARLPLSLKHVADRLKTEELCLKSIEKDVKTLKFTPAQFLTNKLIDECLNRSPWAIGDIPKVCLTKERIERCVKKNGQVLQAIPSELHNVDLYRIAFAQNPMSICYMTDVPMRNEVVREAISHDWPFDYEYEPQNAAQALKFLRSEKAKQSPHLACAYEAYLSEDKAKKPDPRAASYGMDY